ncbi:hypothetical protein L9F63_007446 [Diploptera punctata]|uniref:Up-frameshift suppressor 2 C-terminal domain-containing protein n=1 Tax=Diploptera punctata TaxID=6984 RepID=A0AAD7Z8R7_DIPPU|nr:hypothetical protein L9F63_007446 [Diploptera punctata]
MTETIKPQSIDIPVPVDIKKMHTNDNEELVKSKMGEISMINFVLLTKKGHKQHYRSLVVPVDSELAINFKSGKEAERAEKECVKQLTLDMNQRLEEENYQEMLAQPQKINSSIHQNEERYTRQQRGSSCAEFILNSIKAK